MEVQYEFRLIEPFQSARRILGIPKNMLCFFGARWMAFQSAARILGFPKHTLSLRPLLVVSVSIRRADSQLPKGPSLRIIHVQLKRFNPPRGFSASQSPFFCDALECGKTDLIRAHAIPMVVGNAFVLFCYSGAVALTHCDALDTFSSTSRVLSPCFAARFLARSKNDCHGVARALAAHGDNLRLAPTAQRVETHAVALFIQMACQFDPQFQDLAPVQPALKQ